MTKLIEALTALAEAGAEYLKFKMGAPVQPVLPLTPKVAADPAPKKERKPKAEKVADNKFGAEAIAALGEALDRQNGSIPTRAPITSNPDPLADLMGAAPAAQPQPQVPVLTPEQSILEMKKAAFGVVKAFPAVTANGAGGAPSTEGEDKLRALLAGTFKVAKLMDLTHENRLLFIAAAQSIVTNGAK